MELNKLYLANGMEGSRNIPSKSVDLILCDLPYGTTQNKWDIIIPFNQLWEQSERIIKDNGAIVLTSAEPFTSLLVTSNLKLYKDKWVWIKNKATGHLNAKKMPLNGHEDILVFYKNPPIYNPQMTYRHRPMNAATSKHTSSVYGTGKATLNQAGTRERYPTDVLYFDVVNNDSYDRIHDNQKPVELFEYFIKTYTNEGAIVVDFATGSATTAIACMNTFRNYICFENDEEIYLKAQRRIIRHTPQLRLIA
jgi:DNA modification methylase